MRISDWSSDVCSSDLSQGRDPDCDRARSRIRMSYQHQFTGLTEGIRPTAPLRWRGLDGLVSAFWEAEGERGGGGYYISANPRISRSEEHTSELQSLMRTSYAVFCLNKKMCNIIMTYNSTNIICQLTLMTLCDS